MATITTNPHKNKQHTHSILCCPECKNQLHFSKNDHAYVCKMHGLFPIDGEIVSFVDVNDFDKHWKMNYSEDIPVSKLKSAEKFLHPVIDFYRQSSKAILILDAGCGDGVHAKYICNQKNTLTDILYYGVDISLDGLRITSARIKDHSDFHLYNADISKLPFKNNSFDVSFSFGVLAYTDNPRNSFDEIYRVTKEGGLIGIWIYPKLMGFKGWLFNTLRKFCQVIGPIGTRIIANIMVPFLYFLPTRSKINLKNASWSQCREVVLVNIAPEQLYFPEASEIENWFRNSNIKILETDHENPITIWGCKK